MYKKNLIYLFSNIKSCLKLLCYVMNRIAEHKLITESAYLLEHNRASLNIRKQIIKSNIRL